MVSNPSDDAWFCNNCASQSSRVPDHRHPTTGLSYVCLNARSVVAKRFEFLVYICADAVAVTETFLDESLHDSHITPPGYCVFCCDCNRHVGGVLALACDCFNAFCCADLDTESELLWIELPTNKVSVLFGVPY